MQDLRGKVKVKTGGNPGLSWSPVREGDRRWGPVSAASGGPHAARATVSAKRGGDSCPPITGAHATSLPRSVSTPSIQGAAIARILLVQKQSLKAKVPILRSQGAIKESRSEPRLSGANACPPDLCILLPKWFLRNVTVKEGRGPAPGVSRSVGRKVTFLVNRVHRPPPQSPWCVILCPALMGAFLGSPVTCGAHPSSFMGGSAYDAAAEGKNAETAGAPVAPGSPEPWGTHRSHRGQCLKTAPEGPGAAQQPLVQGSKSTL